MTLSLMSLSIPPVLGLVFVLFFWPRQVPVQSSLLLKSCLAVGLGLGLSSSIFSLWSIVFNPSAKGFAVAEIMLLACLTAILFYRIAARNDPAASHLHVKPVSKTETPWALWISFSLAFSTAVAAFVFLSLNSPHGEWDAWAIWNMRARFIFRGGERWTDGFSDLLGWSHPDYPLMIPALVARCWNYIGHETVVAPALVAMLFTFATVGLTFSSLSILRSRSQGFLAGLVLLGTPHFIKQGASQQADVPLGFFFLATIVLICLGQRPGKGDHRLLPLAGLSAGFAAWTKNEGLLFVASVILAHLAVMAAEKRWSDYFRQIKSFATGLVPASTMTLYYKTQIAPPNDLISSLGLQSSWDRFWDASRYWQLWNAFEREMTPFDSWVLGITALLVLYPFFLGITFKGKDKTGIAASLVTLCLMLAGYCLTYIISPYELHWFLETSFNRLLVQLWPTTLFAFFLLVNTPEETSRVKARF